jgi:hypothetical protein
MCATICNINEKRLYHEDNRLQHVKNIVTTQIYNICNIKNKKKQEEARSSRSAWGSGGRPASSDALHPIAALLSHPIFRRKPSAYLYACQDQVSCI